MVVVAVSFRLAVGVGRWEKKTVGTKCFTKEGERKKRDSQRCSRISNGGDSLYLAVLPRCVGRAASLSMTSLRWAGSFVRHNPVALGGLLR